VLGSDGLPVFGGDGLPVLEDVIILPDDPSAFIGRGTRALADLNARLDLGRGGPIATTLTGDHRSLRYSGGATDADSTRTSLGAESLLRLSPVTTGVLRLGFSRFASEDADRLQRVRLAIRVGLQHELSERLEISAGVGPGRVVTRNRVDETRDVRSGLDGDLAATYGLRNGSIGLRLSAVTDEDGTRRSISLERSLELARARSPGPSV
jgi:hypothetical protein